MDPALENRQADRRSQDRRRSSSSGTWKGRERRRFDRRRAMAGAGLMAALTFGGLRAQQRLSPPTQDSSHTLFLPGAGTTSPGEEGSADDGEGEDLSELERRRAALEPFIQAAAHEYGVSPDLVRAVVETESQFDPSARSRAGAVGAMQLMPRTARSIGIEDPLDPEENIFGGTRYLSTLLRRFNGNTALALAGYNAGPTLVARHGRIPPYRETQNYVRKIHNLVADTGAAFHLPAPPRQASVKTARSKSRAASAVAKKASSKKTVMKRAPAQAKPRAKAKGKGRRA